MVIELFIKLVLVVVDMCFVWCGEWLFKLVVLVVGLMIVIVILLIVIFLLVCVVLLLWVNYVNFFISI